MMPVLTVGHVESLATDILVAAGALVEDARSVSNLLVKANLAGHDSHGVIRIIQYVKAIERGEIKPDAEIEVVRETCSTALLNGNWGFGQVVAKRAMVTAINKARESSVGAVSAFNLYHVGRLADYTEMALHSDMIGIAMANAIKSVAPYGGYERLLSTSPVSYAFPTSKETPFVLDIATSVCAEGKVRVTLHKGEKLPEGCIVDGDGNPSNDPEDYYAGGALLPLGGDFVGYKGFGLALAVEVMAGILSGAGCAYEPAKRGNSIFFEAIDIRSFMHVEEFKRRVDDLIRTVKSSKLRPGWTEIFTPGEPEHRTEQKRLREGIYVPERTWDEIINIAKELNVDLAVLEA